MKNIIEVKNLTKRYQEILAVVDLSFSVRQGEIFSLLGVNGAGKSTTINIICGIVQKDAGKILIDDIDIDDDKVHAKYSLGIVFQSSVLDKLLTPEENLRSRAALYNITGTKCRQRIDELAKLLCFEDYLKRPLNKLSGGQKRRIDIARALIHEPKVLILDEPTTGLDPQTRALVWDVINRLRIEKKMTVLLTTHYMEEAGSSNYVIIIDDGKIICKGTPVELKGRYSGDFVNLYFKDEADIDSLVDTLRNNNYDYHLEAKCLKIKIDSSEDAVRLITNQPQFFKDFEVIKGTMDDVFLNVTGKSLKGAI